MLGPPSLLLSRAYLTCSSHRITALDQGTVAFCFKGKGSCGPDKKFRTGVPQNLIFVVQGVFPADLLGFLFLSSHSEVLLHRQLENSTLDSVAGVQRHSVFPLELARWEGFSYKCSTHPVSSSCQVRVHGGSPVGHCGLHCVTRQD